MNLTIDWTKDFYSRSRERWGPSGVLPHHRERAESIQRLCGPGKKRILELGAGAGGTAAALADLGHDVTAIDIAPPSIAYAQELARENRPGKMTVLEADFFTVVLQGTFDVIGYWNGFGIGTDTDQRRLLVRIATEWLAPTGTVLMDVFHPAPWLKNAGQEKRVETERKGTFIQRSSFDPIGCRFIDQWQSEGDSTNTWETQSIRCYTPADFLLLLEGTGLAICHAEINGTTFPVRGNGGKFEPQWDDAWEYLVQLCPYRERR